MSKASCTNILAFPATPSSRSSVDRIASRFLTSVVVDECRKSCEELAGTLQGDLAYEHETINDCLAACDEYSVATARESKHTARYALWCSERCADLISSCERLDTPASRSTAKWLKAVADQMNREVISWSGVKNAMNQEVTWDSVKQVMNKEVIRFDPFGGNDRRHNRQSVDTAS